MSTREDFEAWAISVQLSTTRCEGLGGYAFYETRKALESWQAATSRQEAKIKALVDALEGVAAMARCGQLDNFIGEPWLNSVHQALAVGDWPDDSREAYLELKQAIAQEQATHKPAGCRETWKCSHTWKCDNCGNGITLHEGQRYCHTKEMA